MNPDEQNQPQQETPQVTNVQADVYNEPASTPEVPPKKASVGVFFALLVVGVLLLGTAGYFIWQTIENVNKGSTQQQTGGDQPSIDGVDGPFVEPPTTE